MHYCSVSFRCVWGPARWGFAAVVLSYQLLVLCFLLLVFETVLCMGGCSCCRLSKTMDLSTYTPSSQRQATRQTRPTSCTTAWRQVTHLNVRFVLSCFSTCTLYSTDAYLMKSTDCFPQGWHCPVACASTACTSIPCSCLQSNCCFRPLCLPISRLIL